MSDEHLKTWLLTPVQKQGVVQTARRIVVTAGAGTGKTRVLTSRFAHLVLSRAARIDRILAITFTEKAAVEMTDRVARLFEEAGRPDLRRKVPEASISTIHAFCARLLRENAIEAGVDPAFEIITDFEKDRLVDASLNLALTRIQTSQAARYEHLTRTLRTEGRFGADLFGAIAGIYESLRVGRLDLAGAFFIPPPKPEFDRVFQALEESIARYRTAARAAKPTATLEGNEEALALLTDRLDKANPEATAQACLGLKIGLRLAREIKPLAEEIRTLAAELGQAAAELYAADTRALLSELVAQFDACCNEAKRNSSCLDFSDLEQRTLDLLDRRPDVQENVRERFRYVMVDEFQDVNRLQAELVARVSHPDNLFIVGDHKQSIYAFRQADVQVFQEEVKKSGEATLSLRENFRSQKPILDFVNHYFETAWADLPESLRYEPLEPGALQQIPDDDAPAVELLATLAEPETDIRVAEAQTLARRILMLLSGSEGKQYEPGDITVLFRAKTKAAPFLAEFIRRHIPFQEVKGRGFFERAEIIDLQRYLEVLSDPYDELALAASLRSPFAAIGEDSLFRLCAAGSELEGGLHDACRRADEIPDLDPRDVASIHRFLAVLDDIESQACLLPLNDLVRQIYDATGYRIWALTQPDAARKNGNIERCIHSALDYAKPYGPTPGGLAAAIADFRNLGLQAQDASIGAPGNSVTLMSVHAAKGLEAPVVILADCNHKDSVFSDPIAYHPDAGVGFKVYLSDFTAVETKTLQAVKEAKSREAQEEDLRLLYVAMTRARERLIFSCAMRPDARNHIGTYGWCKKILGAFGLDVKEYKSWPGLFSWTPEIRVRIRKSADLTDVPPPEKHRPVVEEALVLSRFDQLPEQLPLPDGSRYLYTISEITGHASCPRRFYLQHRVGLPIEFLADPGDEEPIEETENGPSRIEAIAFGIAVHEMLALDDYPADPGWIATAKRIGKRNGLAPEAIDRALAILSAFAGNPDAGLFSKAKANRELPFLWRTEGRLIRGKLDLLIDGPDELWLIDYKTNRVGEGGPEGIARQYQLQMTLYAMAVEALRHRPPDRVSLYLTELDRFVDIDCGPKAIATARQAIASILAADREGIFPPPVRRCPTCNHRHWCRPDLNR